MHQDYDSYEMNKLDLIRIEPLKKQIRLKNHCFKFFISNVYHHYCSYDLVQKHNREIRRTIRSFFKDDIKMIFFIERCMNGSFHRHILIEDAAAHRWEYPSSSRMKNFLDPLDYFSCLSGMGLSDLKKIDLLDRVIRLLPFISNGKKALDIRPIHNHDKLLAYCTKQFEWVLPSYEIIDPASSDIDMEFFIQYKQVGDQWVSRYEDQSSCSQLISSLQHI